MALPQAMDRAYKEERNYILGLVKQIKASGCNVLLIQKSILRDATTDLSLHYLVGVACCHQRSTSQALHLGGCLHLCRYSVDSHTPFDCCPVV
jgi:hypothetical protein